MPDILRRYNTSGHPDRSTHAHGMQLEMVTGHTDPDVLCEFTLLHSTNDTCFTLSPTDAQNFRQALIRLNPTQLTISAYIPYRDTNSESPTQFNINPCRPREKYAFPQIGFSLTEHNRPYWESTPPQVENLLTQLARLLDHDTTPDSRTATVVSKDGSEKPLNN